MANLTQQLTANEHSMSGRLTITAHNGDLQQLQTLAVELSQRDYITTHGNVIAVPPEPVPPTPDTPDPGEPQPEPHGQPGK